MSKKVAFNINLLPKDPFFETILGKTLKWALSVGRYIVIFTELIVIISFITRFSLDRQVTDLNRAIEQKRNVILSYGEVEPRMRRYQALLEQYQQIDQQQNIITLFPELSRITPLDVKLDTLTITPTGVTLSGTTLSQNSLTLLINNMQLSSLFESINVGSIEADQQSNSGFQFEIKATTSLTPTRPAARTQSAGSNTPAVSEELDL
ncbi:MAG TPA: PilN domain-containing protein [Patescibacteria group bacterium]